MRGVRVSEHGTKVQNRKALRCITAGTTQPHAPARACVRPRANKNLQNGQYQLQRRHLLLAGGLVVSQLAGLQGASAAKLGKLDLPDVDIDQALQQLRSLKDIDVNKAKQDLGKSIDKLGGTVEQGLGELGGNVDTILKQDPKLTLQQAKELVETGKQKVDEGVEKIEEEGTKLKRQAGKALDKAKLEKADQMKEMLQKRKEYFEQPVYREMKEKSKEVRKAALDYKAGKECFRQAEFHYGECADLYSVEGWDKQVAKQKLVRDRLKKLKELSPDDEMVERFLAATR